MRIATWNIDLMKHGADKIQTACEHIQADILVLTESDDRVQLNYEHCFHTPTPPDIEGTRFGVIRYAPTEHRVSILTDYPCLRKYITADPYTSLCVELETERGLLLVYGTIIGSYDVTTIFPQDLARQIPDFQKLAAVGKDLCVCGDFNCCFSGQCWPSKLGKETLLQSFSQNHLKLLTQHQPECVDHIAISEPFVSGVDVHVEEWNLDRKVSDHKGIAVSF